MLSCRVFCSNHILLKPYFLSWQYHLQAASPFVSRALCQLNQGLSRHFWRLPIVLSTIFLWTVISYRWVCFCQPLLKLPKNFPLYGSFPVTYIFDKLALQYDFFHAFCCRLFTFFLVIYRRKIIFFFFFVHAEMLFSSKRSSGPIPKGVKAGKCLLLFVWVLCPDLAELLPIA